MSTAGLLTINWIYSDFKSTTRHKITRILNFLASLPEGEFTNEEEILDKVLLDRGLDNQAILDYTIAYLADFELLSSEKSDQISLSEAGRILLLNDSSVVKFYFYYAMVAVLFFFVSNKFADFTVLQSIGTSLVAVASFIFAKKMIIFNRLENL